MKRSSLLLALALLSVALPGVPAESPRLEPVQVTRDGKGFMLDKSGRAFTPWGFNYDHDASGRLIEDYWETEWPKVEEDFREMKELGANVVRVHLQFGKFMNSTNAANEKSLAQLKRLVALAERTRLYLDLTGLGCYHKQDVPPWYDVLSESARWAAQANFWRAIARQCKDSPAIFCYDLMNEPVVPGKGSRQKEWLGPPFAGKHFVQFISRDIGTRERTDVARAWIEQLTAAIRAEDSRHSITVGLVDWSLDRPGLTSGFVPQKVARDLDFVSVHIYPQSGKVAEAIATLDGFATGKPIVIEEIFPLKCSAEELGDFIRQSRSTAAGWIGFYWGKTPDEYRDSKEIGDVLTLQWLELFRARAQ